MYKIGKVQGQHPHSQAEEQARYAGMLSRITCKNKVESERGAQRLNNTKKERRKQKKTQTYSGIF